MGIVTSQTDKNQTCIDACNRCAQACDECLMLCLNEQDVQARVKCIGTLKACASICTKAACFMSSDSEFSKDICKLCATICKKCATECGMFKDDHCNKCAAECTSCADECSSMSM